MTAHAHPIAREWSNPANTVAALPGTWTLHRHIDSKASMTGTAVFAAGKDDWLAYRECGELRLTNGQAFQAERRYLFQPRSAGFAVFFAETPPRLFHEVALTETQGVLWGEASHLCADDRYESRYEFKRDGTFSIHHAVHGPRKSYRSDTTYRRLESSSTF